METESQNAGNESFEAASFGEALSPEKSTGDSASPNTTVGSVVETPVQASSPAEPAVKTDAPIVTKADVVESQERMVPLSAVIAERQKRQRAEQLAYDLQNQIQQPLYQPQYTEDTAQTEKVIETRLTKMSEYMAKQAHPDYDEKFQIFQEAALQNPALYDTVMKSEFPGEAAYQAGKSLLVQKKYGVEALNDPEKLVSKLEKEVEERLSKKFEADYQAKLQGKLQERSKTPTDISLGRAANTKGSDESFVSVGWKDALARGRRKRS